jgi:folate-binding Fe-S cluster repair protein YgfZ
VVARLNTYDKVQRKLVRLSWEGTLAEKDITYDGHLVGVITSAMNGAGLGFVRNSHAELRRELECGNQKVMVTEILAE